MKKWNFLICIEKCGFAHSTNMKRITIPSSVKKIEEETFIGCSSLKTVIFQSKSGIRKIPKYCFAFCALKSIKLPDYIEVIDDSSFLSCKELHEVLLFETKVKFISDSSIFNTCIANMAALAVHFNYLVKYGLELNMKAITNVARHVNITS